MDYIKNAISKLYDPVSARAVFTRDALVEIWQSVRDTTYFVMSKDQRAIGILADTERYRGKFSRERRS